MTDAHSGLLGVPYQLLVDAVLPLLELGELMALRAVAPGLRAAIDDDVVWRRKIVRDFRFPLSSSARTAGWKTLYRGLSDAEMYTWGDYSCDRLGVRFRSLPNESTADCVARIGAHLWLLITRVHCVPLPIRVAWRDSDRYDGAAHVVNGNQARHEPPPPAGVPLVQQGGTIASYAARQILPHGRRQAERKGEVGVPVELHAGGWSFFALTHLGQVLAFGRSAANGMTVETEVSFVTPTLLDLGGRAAKQLSVGRAHAVAHMDDGVLLEWSQRWDRPAMHVPASLTDQAGFEGTSSRIRQVEAGWDFTAILVDDASGAQSGDDVEAMASVRNEVLIWRTEWTYGELRKQWYESAQSETDPLVEIDVEWPVSMVTVKLPTLKERIKRIAAGDRFVIALTEYGGLYYLAIPGVSLMESHGTARQQAEGVRQSMVRNFTGWKRMALFCDTPYEAGWNKDHSENVWDQDELSRLLKSSTKITHVSAQFQSFAVYAPEAGKAAALHGEGEGGGQGRGIVILGAKDKLEAPVVVPQLQGIGVVKVVHGDWHTGALTQDGRVVTWGSQSNGALGTWDATPAPENAESLLSRNDTHIPVPTAGLGATATGVFRRLMRLRQLEGTEDEAQEEQRADDREHHTTPPPPTSIAGGAYSKDDMVDAERQRYRYRRLPDKVPSPQQVRFGFPILGERRNGRAVQADDAYETKFVFDVAAAGWHSGALAVDRRLLSADDSV